MDRPTKLSAPFVAAVSNPGRYGDGYGGHGLSLLVKPRARGGVSKSWSQRLTIAGKAVNIGLGAYPIFTLAEARAKALDNRRAVALGGDPRRQAPSVPSFTQAAEKVIRIQAEGWTPGGKSEDQWRSSLAKHVLPALGSTRVSEIEPREVMAVLLPIWQKRPETARRVRQRMGAVFKWAVAQGFRTDNPAGEVLGAALPKQHQRPQHFAALPHNQIAAALARVRASDAYPATKLGLEFAVLTAARSGEVRLGRWAEICLDTATWTIPPARMKARREHRVPLSAPALDVLDQAGVLADASGLLFPSPTGRALSNSTFSKLCRELELGCVPHGMRSSFADWAAECSNAPREVRELALAHVNSDRVEAAYRRTDLFERRRTLMAEWGRYVTAP